MAIGCASGVAAHGSQLLFSHACLTTPQDADPPAEVLRAAQREFKRLQRGSEQHPGGSPLLCAAVFLSMGWGLHAVHWVKTRRACFTVRQPTLGMLIGKLPSLVGLLRLLTPMLPMPHCCCRLRHVAVLP